MWEELRLRSGRNGPLAPVASAERLRQVIEEAQNGRPDVRLLIAELDGTAAGMASVMLVSLGPFINVPVAQIDYLHVRPSFSRRGVGHALVDAAAQFADLLGVEHVSVNVFPQLREANRFYAKIGFAPLVVRRVATTATLRRRLGLGYEGAVPARRAGLVARRRSVLRARRASTVA
jgi:GNAT superfamily N-acetyltransferase